MQILSMWLALFLLLNIAAGLWRAFRGPTPADRMSAIQLLSTTAVATLLLLAEASGREFIRDVALVFALLAAITALAFVKLAWSDQESNCDAQ